jgi:hypothetical protein
MSSPPSKPWYTSWAERAVAQETWHSPKRGWFRYAVVPDAYDPGAVEDAAQEMLACTQWQMKFKKWPTEWKKRATCNPDSKKFPCCTYLLKRMRERSVVQVLEQSMGIAKDGLSADETGHGAGMHSTEKTGRLEVHADFNMLKDPKEGEHRWRYLNALLYLNRDWTPQTRGELQLWNKKHTECVCVPVSINTLVVFHTHDQSWHGHPGQWNSAFPRNSLAMYYYARERHPLQSRRHHSTLWCPMPTIEWSEDKAEFTCKDDSVSVTTVTDARDSSAPSSEK